MSVGGGGQAATCCHYTQAWRERETDIKQTGQLCVIFQFQYPDGDGVCVFGTEGVQFEFLESFASEWSKCTRFSLNVNYFNTYGENIWE